MSNFQAVFYDFSDENSKINWPVADTVNLAAASSLLAAINGLQRGTQGEVVLTIDEIVDAGSTARPANADAQREDKWSIKYRDTVNNRPYYRQIPCANRQLLSGGTEYLDLANATVQTFVTSYEANILSPYGNPVEVISIKYVGAAL